MLIVIPSHHHVQGRHEKAFAMEKMRFARRSKQYHIGHSIGHLQRVLEATSQLGQVTRWLQHISHWGQRIVPLLGLLPSAILFS